jgi:hypothetical protein
MTDTDTHTSARKQLACEEETYENKMNTNNLIQ